MIITGTLSMCVLLHCLFRRVNIGNAPLFWLLMAAMVYYCLKVLHEWYHYFYISVPVRPVSVSKPTVDIITTFCEGEPYEMIVETLTALQAITYPHTTYLGDEADDPYLKEVCHRLGVVHVTRNDRTDAKAGNINNVLRQATGELCVVLDPDHVPATDFLHRVIPFFDNPDIGYVQIVQAYGNVGDSIIAKGAAQQTFQFYGPMMMTMNTYGTVQAIGANCTFRRSALDSIGGHAAGLAEDMHTAMRLHAKGWKSVYVPEVLTLGLVPSTLSAYYKQQLKWARGTFELLVTTYPQLFFKFNWRQKLHYGILPFHYFSGVIFLINFLVPILSLCLGVIPFSYDLISFGLVGLPFLCITLFIRHFVQRWVMAEEESGFHMVGGLLLIGTWWVFILGLIYTLVRRKVPYIPTPKDDRDATSWKLLAPNASVLIVSAGAIVYGLWLDWNPYSLVMAGIAFMNCLIMLFNILAGIWRGWPGSSKPVTLGDRFFHYYYATKVRIWKLRHGVYVMMRRSAMPLTLMVCGCASWFVHEDGQAPAPVLQTAPLKEQVFYTGIFSPEDSTGLTSMRTVENYSQITGTHFDIISCYIPWGDSPHCYPQPSLLNRIYDKGAVPMFTWEPWTSLFNPASGIKEEKVMQQICEGKFDSYINRFAQQLAALQKPVFLRFAHEPENERYPWSPAGMNTPEEYRAAWKYVHDHFIRAGARNVIWVWNPWKAGTAAGYFPGKDYVDWLGVTILNYGKEQPGGRSYSFSQLYVPFHDDTIFRMGLPVMVAELGSLHGEGDQRQWLQDAYAAIGNRFPEINAAVLFNSDADRNVITGRTGNLLDWKLEWPEVSLTGLQEMQDHSHTLHPPLALLTTMPRREHTQLPDTLNGVIYSKGIPWFRNRHTLTRKVIEKDMRDMRKIGINAIRRYGPGVYDHNILTVSKETGIRVQYAFWMPLPGDAASREAFKAEVLATVANRKHDKSIIGWHLGNNSWNKLQQLYGKPSLLYEQEVYLDWLKQLVHAIRMADPDRPVTVDIPADNTLSAVLQTFAGAIPEVTSWGLVWPTDAVVDTLPQTDIPIFMSRITADQYLGLENSPAHFINEWQDLQTKDLVTFDGLLDHYGHYKPAYAALAGKEKVSVQEVDLPEVRILRPAMLTLPGAVLSYRALLYENGRWVSDGSTDPDLHFEWSMYKTDGQGNTIYMRALGKGPVLNVRIPEDQQLCGLYLIISKKGFSRSTMSTLNTPWRKK